MAGFSALQPYTDPGSLMGGVREHRATLNRLQADAYRDASQTQQIDQDARAFSGAEVNNDQSQTADIDQSADAMTTRTVTIQAVTGTNEHAANFEFNYLQHYIAGVDAEEFLARASSNEAQAQNAGQFAASELADFQGNGSVAENVLDQRADVEQQFDVDLTATISNTTVADDVANAFNQARYRLIEANLADQMAEAIFTSGQSQGTLGNPVEQTAIANHGKASNSNDLMQDLGIRMPHGTVDLEAEFDLSRFESATLSPRSTDLLINLNKGDTGVSGAVNSSASCQEQAHRQNGAGGADLRGNTTENGGIAENIGTANVEHTEDTIVNNSISVIV